MTAHQIDVADGVDGDGALRPALIELRPGDRILLECEQRLSHEQGAQLRRCVTTWLTAEDQPPLVLHAGVRFVVVRKT